MVLRIVFLIGDRSVGSSASAVPRLQLDRTPWMRWGQQMKGLANMFRLSFLWVMSQVAKAMEKVIPLPLFDAPLNDPRREELREMQRRKMEIDRRAETWVRRELWCGLAFLVAQTAAFMRLTFWELTWDVMEPICFYVTSIYFMAGYVFFLRTSREPSFEGFFESRMAAKQRRLMRAANFDLRRFHELSRAFNPSPASPPLEFSEVSTPLPSSACDCHLHHTRESLVGAMH